MHVPPAGEPNPGAPNMRKKNTISLHLFFSPTFKQKGIKPNDNQKFEGNSNDPGSKNGLETSSPCTFRPQVAEEIEEIPGTC